MSTLTMSTRVKFIEEVEKTICKWKDDLSKGLYYTSDRFFTYDNFNQKKLRLMSVYKLNYIEDGLILDFATIKAIFDLIRKYLLASEERYCRELACTYAIVTPEPWKLLEYFEGRYDQDAKIIFVKYLAANPYITEPDRLKELLNSDWRTDQYGMHNNCVHGEKGEITVNEPLQSPPNLEPDLFAISMRTVSGPPVPGKILLKNTLFYSYWSETLISVPKFDEFENHLDRAYYTAMVVPEGGSLKIVKRPNTLLHMAVDFYKASVGKNIVDRTFDYDVEDNPYPTTRRTLYGYAALIW